MFLGETSWSPRTIHVAEYNFIWDLESGTHGLTMKRKLKKIIDDKYDGDPEKFRGRAVFLCCLNDLDSWAKTREEPMPAKYIKNAQEIRDYLKLFEVGRIIWLGPGSEKIWGYDNQNAIWDPWADTFMDIIAESGIPIFKGRHALKDRVLMAKNNCHFAGNTENKKMLIDFIHSSLQVASFLGMVKNSPGNTEARDECTDMEVQSEAVSVHGG